MRRRWSVLGVVAVMGCATTPTPEPPRVRVMVQDTGPIGAACDGRVVPVRGPRPEGTRVIATVTAAADRPVALETLEQAALVMALRRCAGGLSILRAEAADGTDGYLSVTAEAWETTEAETTSPPLPAPPVPAPG